MLTALPHSLRGPLRNALEMAVTLQPSDAIFGYREREKGKGKKRMEGKGGWERGNRGRGKGAKGTELGTGPPIGKGRP